MRPPAPPDYDGAHLRHLLPSAAASLGLSGFTNRLHAPQASIAVVILTDGLGESNLAAHTGHARFLSKAWRSQEQARVLDTGTPTTTVASLSSLGTGLTPGQHGMVGYDVYAPEVDRVVNLLGRWDPKIDPLAWQPRSTVLEAAADAGAEVLTVSREQFRDSALTLAALRGGGFLGASTIEARFSLAAEWIAQHRPRPGRMSQGPVPRLLIYLYVDELDKTGHSHGAGSVQWRTMLESLDAAAATFCSELRDRYGDQVSVLLSADHGMVNVAEQHRIDISGDEALLSRVRHTAGEPRLLHLYTDRGSEDRVRSAWEQRFGDQIWALTGTAAIESGWFGPVEPRVRGRIGDVLIAARDEIALFHTDRTGTQPLNMVGQHGSLTEAERRVPLLELTGRGFSA